jgi:hypothetical protein
MSKQPVVKSGRRDSKSKAIIFDPSPENRRIDRLKAVVEKIVGSLPRDTLGKDDLIELLKKV